MAHARESAAARTVIVQVCRTCAVPSETVTFTRYVPGEPVKLKDGKFPPAATSSTVHVYVRASSSGSTAGISSGATCPAVVLGSAGGGNAATGGAFTRIVREVVSVLDELSVTVRVMVYVTGSANACWIATPLPVVVSPKSQS